MCTGRIVLSGHNEPCVWVAGGINAVGEPLSESAAIAAVHESVLALTGHGRSSKRCPFSGMKRTLGRLHPNDADNRSDVVRRHIFICRDQNWRPRAQLRSFAYAEPEKATGASSGSTGMMDGPLPKRAHRPMLATFGRRRFAGLRNL
jgi:hypothetical protein